MQLSSSFPVVYVAIYSLCFSESLGIARAQTILRRPNVLNNLRGLCLWKDLDVVQIIIGNHRQPYPYHHITSFRNSVMIILPIIHLAIDLIMHLIIYLIVPDLLSVMDDFSEF